ncbi:hypothetical protein ACHHYP_03764 [Achlya hypogyna]|uniref:Haloacid dehalogenase-like hydrolase n=1 Tax=Achlya hypogyna TaxID=1202772 RepID=A0A1V9ZPM7_ACHHY|nr:hypothetical protein ACHHYP_03764 [Achlya hypogyna]
MELVQTLYEFYSTRAAWEVFDEVHEVLRTLQDEGVPMGVVSNFDERLEGILETLDLRGYFDFVLTSWDHGSPKPAASIFHAAAALHGVAEKAAMVHVGDDETNDVAGPVAAGYTGRLLSRKLGGSLATLLLKDQMPGWHK